MIRRNRKILLIASGILYLVGIYFFYSDLIFHAFTLRYFIHVQWHLIFISTIELLIKSMFIYLQWNLLVRTTKNRMYFRLVAGSIVLPAGCFAMEYLIKKGLYPGFVGFQVRQFPIWSFNLAEYIICLLAVMTVFYLRQWVRSEKQKNEIIQHQLSSELEFLKHQVNPHFLFNTLNSLFSFAQKYNAPELQNGLVRFSDFLRYAVYDTSAQRIPLSKEIKYINDYIELIKLRFEKDELAVNFTATGNIDAVSISPMMMLPFVENAFKYGTIAEEVSVINISFNVNESFLIFRCDNAIISAKKNPLGHAGIGIRNVKRRLELLYPGEHVLKIYERENRFYVYLELNKNI